MSLKHNSLFVRKDFTS